MKYKLEVEPFSHDFMQSQGGKALALKPLEEAAEAFGAWQRYEGDEWDVTDDELEVMLRDEMADELADTVQACVNLAGWEGLDLSAALSRIHDRNAERGRHEVRNGCEEVRTCCAEDEKPITDEAGRAAAALRALESPDWPSLTEAVLGRNGTRREVVQRLAGLVDRGTCHFDLIDGREAWFCTGCGGGEMDGDTASYCPDCGRRIIERHDTREADSWEQLEADIGKTPCSYFNAPSPAFCGSCPHDGETCKEDMARNIVRRAKKLAKAEVVVEE